MSGRRERSAGDPFSVLGLDARTATRADVVSARRRLARDLHPDVVGGDGDDMRSINRAADAALKSLAGVAPQPDESPTGSKGSVQRDHPSFTIDVLPVEAFEALLIVTGWLGQLIDDDPPYRLEALLENGIWCALELVPDAAATTVSVAVDTGEAVEAVRDLWVSALNLLDWEGLDPAQQRPW